MSPPGRARDLDLYRNIMLDDLEAAIARGCSVLHVGRTSQSFKSSLGATPARSITWCKHRRRAGQRLIRRVVPYIAAGEWIERHPELNVREIERVTVSHPSEVADRLDRNQPVIFERAIDEWGATGKWSPAYFAEAFPEHPLRLYDFTRRDAIPSTFPGFLAYLERGERNGATPLVVEALTGPGEEDAARARALRPRTMHVPRLAAGSDSGLPLPNHGLTEVEGHARCLCGGFVGVIVCGHA